MFKHHPSMASPISVARAATLAFLLLVAINAICLEAKGLKLKQTNIVFYMQDWQTGINITSVPVAGIGKAWSVLNFGTINVLDDKLTVALDRNSPQVGRAHGIYVNSALDNSDLHMLMSVVFTDKKFNGSTLEIQGADRLFLKYREVSVVSGTGKFRMARGYAILETVYLNLPGLNAIIRWKVTVFHY